MRPLAPLALLLLAAAPEPAAIDTLASDAEGRWVAFALTPANQIRFTATVDGRTVGAILDTGVSHTALSRRFVAAAGLPVRGGATALAIGGAVASGWVDTHDLAVGAVTRRGGRATVADLPLAATGGAAVDLLVGRDVTSGYALEIDYDAHRFRLLRSGRMPFRGSVAPLRIAGTWPSYVTEITVGTRRLERVMVDTGDGSALTLSRASWETLGRPRPVVTTTIAYGIGGAVPVELAIVPQVRSGSLIARAMEVRIEAANGYTAAVGMSARLGSGFLSGYHVLLDPGAGRLVLAPGVHADQPPLRSTSGLLLRAERDRLTVLHVMRGSPAEATGWRVGEQICSVDGAAVRGESALRWPVDVPGRTVRLALCSGAVRTITLRSFY